ncbi:hypothetical protein [Sneathiella glossodoripedis]|uniref:hypothetical protein n=1 Tax=Sneathiella glossodoripedis TaxID=418853 RepID=UPI000472DEFE|nr:hypothetical protein [Sneathiella glossodoripedis]
MKIFTRLVAGAAALFMLTSVSNAAYVSSFNKHTNDGVYTLNQAQKDFFGVSGAEYIGFLRVRSGNGVSWNAGDYFDQTSVLNSTGSDSKILALLNGLGDPANVTYTGNNLETLGSTTLVNSSADVSGIYEGIAFLFGSTVGDIVFNGTATFNQGQTRGEWDYQVSVVPLPAALPLYAAGVAVLGFLGWKRRRSAA